MMRIRFEFTLLAAWLAMPVVAGYVIAPVLFAHLEKMTAGNIAGILFHYVSYTGLAAAAGLLFSGCLQRGTRAMRIFWGIALASVLINEFIVTPVIAAHKTQSENWLLSLAGGSFALWHGISELIYLATVICVTAFAWLWCGRLREVSKW